MSKNNAHSIRSDNQINADIFYVKKRIEKCRAYKDLSPLGYNLDKVKEEDIDLVYDLVEELSNLQKEFDDRLDLVKHGYMHWVDGTQRQHQDTHGTSAYYYFLDIQQNYIFRSGWWQFDKYLKYEHIKHFQEHLNDYMSHNKPKYGRKYPSQSDIAFCNKKFIVYTADQWNKLATKNLFSYKYFS